MSEQYIIRDQSSLYLVSFATVYWIDIMVRDAYFNLIIDSLDHCRKNKGLEIYCFCTMSFHIHLIIRAKGNNPDKVLGSFKEYISSSVLP